MDVHVRERKPDRRAQPGVPLVEVGDVDPTRVIEPEAEQFDEKPSNLPPTARFPGDRIESGAERQGGAAVFARSGPRGDHGPFGMSETFSPRKRASRSSTLSWHATHGESRSFHRNRENPFSPKTIPLRLFALVRTAQCFVPRVQMQMATEPRDRSAQARHLLDQAAALTRTDQHRRALDMLLTAERVGGAEWVRYQTLLKQVVGELSEEDGQSSLRALAERVGVR